MAIKTFYLTNNTATGSNFHQLQDGGSVPTLARLTTGWIVGTTAVPRYALMEKGVERATTALTTTVLPNAGPNNAVSASAGDSFRTESTYTGNFAAGNWDITFLVAGETRATSSHDGRLRVRIYRSTSATGAGATQLTGATVTTTQYINLTNTAYQTLTVSIALGAFSLTNEYLFIQVALQHDATAGNAGADTHLGVGTDAASTAQLITPDFAPPVITENGATSLGGTSAVAIGGGIVKYAQSAIGGVATVSARAASTAPVGMFAADQVLSSAGTSTGTRVATSLRSAESIAYSIVLRPPGVGPFVADGSSDVVMRGVSISRGAVQINGRSSGGETLVPSETLTPSATLTPGGTIGLTWDADVQVSTVDLAQMALGGSSAVSAAGSATLRGAVAAAGTSQVSTLGRVTRGGVLNVDASASSVTSTGVRVRYASMASAGSSSVVESARRIARPATQINGVASVSVDRRAILRGSVGIAGDTTDVRFSESSSSQQFAQMVVSGSSSVSPLPRRIATASMQINGAGALQNVAGRVRRAGAVSVGVSATVLPLTVWRIRTGPTSINGASSVVMRARYGIAAGRLASGGSSSVRFVGTEVGGSPVSVPGPRWVSVPGRGARRVPARPRR